MLEKKLLPGNPCCCGLTPQGWEGGDTRQPARLRRHNHYFQCRFSLHQQPLSPLQRSCNCCACVVFARHLLPPNTRYAPSYDDLDGGAASAALGFPQLRQQLLQQVNEASAGAGAANHPRAIT